MACFAILWYRFRSCLQSSRVPLIAGVIAWPFPLAYARIVQWLPLGLYHVPSVDLSEDAQPWPRSPFHMSKPI